MQDIGHVDKRNFTTLTATERKQLVHDISPTLPNTLDFREIAFAKQFFTGLTVVPLRLDAERIVDAFRYPREA